MATGELSAAGRRRSATPRSSTTPRPPQLALAWLLHRSPVMLPIPGTKSVDHLESNIAAAAMELGDKEVAALSAIGG